MTQNPQKKTLGKYRVRLNRPFILIQTKPPSYRFTEIVSYVSNNNTEVGMENGETVIVHIGQILDGHLPTEIILTNPLKVEHGMVFCCWLSTRIVIV